MSRFLLLASIIPILIVAGCKKETISQSDYIECKVNGVAWKSRPSSISADWTNEHIGISGYDNDKSTILSFLVIGKDLKSGTYPLTGKNLAKYDDLKISSSESYYTDSTHNGTVSFVFDEQNHRISGAFSFEAKFETSDQVVKITEGRFLATDIKN